jgi:hypothetical protein
MDEQTSNGHGERVRTDWALRQVAQMAGLPEAEIANFVVVAAVPDADLTGTRVHIMTPGTPQQAAAILHMAHDDLVDMVRAQSGEGEFLPGPGFGQTKPPRRKWRRRP